MPSVDVVPLTPSSVVPATPASVASITPAIVALVISVPGGMNGGMTDMDGTSLH
jgi:hypothetical protein